MRLVLMRNLQPQILRHVADVLEDKTNPNDRFFVRLEARPARVYWYEHDGARVESDANVEVYEITPLVHQWVQFFRRT